MKISEMNNEKAADALIRITTPIGNIFADEETTKMFEQIKVIGEGAPLQELGKIIPKAVTLLLKTHKKDVYEIVGALTFKSVSEVAKMNFVETINVVKDSYDEVLHSFFTSSVKQTNESEEK